MAVKRVSSSVTNSSKILVTKTNAGKSEIHSSTWKLWTFTCRCRRGTIWCWCCWRRWSLLPLITVNSVPQPPNLSISVFPLGNYPHRRVQLWFLRPRVVTLIQHKPLIHTFSFYTGCVMTAVYIRSIDTAMCLSPLVHQWLCGRVPDLQLGGCRFESRPGLLCTKVYSAFHPSGVGKWVPVIAGKAKAGMAHSDCGWTCGRAGKTVKSLQNICHIWALLRWWFTTKRRYIKCMYLSTKCINCNLYLYLPHDHH